MVRNSLPAQAALEPAGAAAMITKSTITFLLGLQGDEGNLP